MLNDRTTFGYLERQNLSATTIKLNTKRDEKVERSAKGHSTPMAEQVGRQRAPQMLRWPGRCFQRS